MGPLTTVEDENRHGTTLNIVVLHVRMFSNWKQYCREVLLQSVESDIREKRGNGGVCGINHEMPSTGLDRVGSVITALRRKQKNPKQCTPNPR